MVDGIGKVIEVKESSFITDTGREFELPFNLKGVTADSLNEWLDYFIEQLKEREARKC
jgi:hypothetical protein